MKRAYTTLLNQYLTLFPCVAILGPRQCGKTTLLKTLPSSWTHFDLEKTDDYDLIEKSPDLFFRLNPDFISIDEAQQLPSLFQALRVAIDQKRSRPGRFVITGSSSPHLLKSISETLAGRVGIIEMAPFSCSEAHEKDPSTFFKLLTSEKHPKNWVNELKPQFSLQEIHRYWWQGGYPEPWIRKTNDFRMAWMSNYVKTYLERDIARLFPQLNQIRFRTFLNLLAGLSGTIINYSDVARSLGISTPTVRDYVDIVHGSFIWRQIPAFEKKSLKRLVKHPKGYFRDGGLLHFLMKIPDQKSLLTHPKMGASWESLVIEEIVRGLQARGLSFETSYYRTAAGAEVDLVLEGDFGLIPIEIKYARSNTGHDLRALREFVSTYKCRLGIMIHNEETVRLYDETLIGIPFSYL